MLSNDKRVRSLLSVFAVALAVLAGEGRQLSAQSSASVAGSVTDASGAPVVDVVVTLAPAAGATAPRSALTDAAGRFRFANLQPGDYELRARRIGFAEAFHVISVASGQELATDFVLEVDTIRVAEVRVEGRAATERERVRFESEPGVTARVIDVAAVRLLPGLAEPDVLRAVEMLPGVVSTSDFSSSYNVRGGSADQNLITIDGFTVFNPFHLGGLFGVFNPDAVERAELFSGGFGAEFGGRVSSVLNIESRTDVPESLQAHGGISLLSTRLLLHAPVPDGLSQVLGADRGSWFVSARRSYFDQILRPIADFPYHLTDLQAHAFVVMPSGGRLALTGYWGEDVFDLSNRDVSGGDDILRLRWGWGNRVAGVSWAQPLPDAWSADVRLGYSRFADRLGFIDFGDVDFASRVGQLTFRTEFARAGSALEPKLGIAIDRTDHTNRADAGGTTFFATDGDGRLASAFTSLRWRPSESWIIEPGVRAEWWRSGGADRSVLSPRFAAKRFLGADANFAVKFAAGRYSQFVHSIRDEELPVSNDTWILADSSIPHIISDQLQLGIEGFWGDGWFGSVEAYVRDFDGVVDFNFAEDPNDPGDDFLAGDGTARGLDLLLRRSEGRLSGWAALSLLRADRTFPDPLAESWEDVFPTVTYPPIHDRRVNLDLVLQYRTGGGTEVGLRWNYGSGLPYTRPIAQHLAWSSNPTVGRFEPADTGPGDDDGPPLTVVLGPRNAERYPAYHRLDVTVRRPIERGWGTYVPFLQVLNVYNRKNVLFYFYDYDREPPVRSGLSMFPFLPALGVEVTF